MQFFLLLTFVTDTQFSLLMNQAGLKTTAMMNDSWQKLLES